MKKYGAKGLMIRRAVAMAMAGLLLAPAARAAGGDPLLEGARLCTQHFPAQEQKNNIPTHLLAAISTTESGRWHQGLGMSVPWPWTINVDGKGYYFNSKPEAIAQTQRLLAQGHQSIDVGCMQVNLKHHPHAFSNLEEAFDPSTNVAYAATFLHDNYAELGDWIKATAAYHSRTPVYGQQYLGEIERSWNTIVAKVSAARAAQGINAPVAGTPQMATLTQATPPEPKMRPIKDTHNVKVIHVADGVKATRASEVLVIRAAPSAPAATPASVNLAEATPIPSTPAEALIRGDSVRKVSLAAPEPTASGPKFVFAN